MDLIQYYYDNILIFRWFVWVILFLFAWLLISIPATILRRVFIEYVTSIISYISRINDRLKTFISKQLEYLKNIHLHFIKTHSFKYVLDDHEKMIERKFTEIKETGNLIFQTVQTSTGDVDKNCSNFQNSVDQLLNYNLKDFGKESLDNYLLPEMIAEIRKSKSAFFISLIFLIALILYNTIMLNLFFGDLISLPPLIYSINLRVSHLLALFFTIIEIGFGYAFYHYGMKKDIGIGSNLVQVLIIFFALCFAAIEAFFYSQISIEAFTQLSKPIGQMGDASILFQEYILTPLGFVLVFMLFILGHIIFSSYHEWKDASLNSEMNERLDDVKKAYDLIANNMDTYKESYEEVKLSIKNYESEVRLDSSAKSKLNDGLQTFINSLESMIKESEESRLNYIELLKDNESLKLFYTYLAYTLGVIIAFVFLTYLETTTLHANNIIRVPYFFLITICLLKIIVLLVCGLYIRKTEKIILAERELQIINDPKSWSIKCICWIIIALIFVHGYFVSTYASKNVLLIYLVIAACYGYLIIIGPKLASIIMILIIASSYIYTILMTLCSYMLILFMNLLQVLVYLIKFIMDILSRPTLMILQKG